MHKYFLYCSGFVEIYAIKAIKHDFVIHLYSQAPSEWASHSVFNTFLGTLQMLINGKSYLVFGEYFQNKRLEDHIAYGLCVFACEFYTFSAVLNF